ncbi:hypothetical protein DL768_006213 [Monosporascus sp. mg162]|nr:hypothetical protein DL768_006213 [Monosporascus sp. mg162]
MSILLFATKAAKPFFLDKKSFHRILLTSAGNKAADSMAAALHKQLQGLHKEPMLPHSPQEARDVITTHVQTYAKEKFEGVADERVQNIELALGTRMKQTAGIQPDDNDPIIQDEPFPRQYSRFGGGEDFSFKDREEFEAGIERLMGNAIQNAATICATVTGAVNSLVTRNYREAELIVVDEAAPMRKYQRWPLLVFYPNAVGKIMHRPLVHEIIRHNTQKYKRTSIVVVFDVPEAKGKADEYSHSKYRNESAHCMVVATSPGFLNKNRPNVLLSRASCGLYVIGNYPAWKKMKSDDSVPLRSFVSELGRFRTPWPSAQARTSRFYPSDSRDKSINDGD